MISKRLVKPIVLSVLVLLMLQFASTQELYYHKGLRNNRDSLRNIINLQRGDTAEVKAILNLVEISLNDISEKFVVRNIDSLFNYLQKALLLAKRINYSKGEADCYYLFSYTNRYTDNYGQQTSFLFKALHIYGQLKDEDAIAATHLYLQGIYKRYGDYKNSLAHAFAAKKLIETIDMKGTRFWIGLRLTPLILAEIGETYLEMNKLDSALFYVQKAIEQNLVFHNAKWNWPIHLLGSIRHRQGKYSLALETYRSAIPLAIQNEFPKDTLDIYNSIALLYKETGQLDSAIYYAKQITNNWNHIWPVEILLLANSTLAEVYKLRGISDSTLKYAERREILKDSIFSQARQKEIQTITFNEQLQQQELTSGQQQNASKLKMYSLLAVIGAILLISFFVYRNNRHKQKAERSEKELQVAELNQKATELEMQALRSQMNPHFIFNSLNSINMFILENNKLQASEYLSKFSKLIRLILQNSQEASIPLERELEALRLYLELESLRFVDKFEYKITVEDDIDTTMLKVPPLIIQPYAENAIWHGLMHLPDRFPAARASGDGTQAGKKEKGHLEIDVYALDEMLFYKITDDGIGRKKAAELKSKSASTQKSMGMRITADRIGMLQQQNKTSIAITDLVLADGSPGGTEVLIAIPVVYD